MSDGRVPNGDNTEWAWVRSAYLATPCADERALATLIERVAADNSRSIDSAPVRAIEGFREPYRLQIAIGVAAAILAAVLLSPRRVDTPVVATSEQPMRAIVGAPAAGAHDSLTSLAEKTPDAIAGVERTPSPRTPAPLSDSKEAVTGSSKSREPAVAVAGTSSTPAPTAVDTAAILGLDARTRALLSGRLSEQAFTELVVIASTARTSGLPVAPITDRAVQGVRRNVSESAVLATARAVTARLATARTALGAQSSMDELTAGADALFAGAAPQVLVELRRTRTQGTAVVPLIVLTDLMTNGVPAQDAAGAVRSMIAFQPTAAVAEVDAGMLAMRTEVAADVARGTAPGIALRARVSAWTESRPTGARPGKTIPAKPSPGVPVPKPPEGF